MSDDYINRWRHQSNAGLGFMNSLGESFTTFETRHPGSLPNLRDKQTLLIGTDFSGSHKSARYSVSTFLITNLEGISDWDLRRTHLRHTLGLGTRRMSYKALNDRIRQQALVPFLQAADLIPGLLFTIAIDRRIQSLFAKQRKLSRETYDESVIKDWKPDTAERALQAAHMACLLIRGLCAPKQDILWLLDEDEIIANQSRHRQFVTLFSQLSGYYLEDQMGNLRIGTTQSDTGKRDIEDLIAICDFACGTFQDVFLDFQERSIPLNAETFVPRTKLKAEKTQVVMDWLATEQTKLKRVNMVVEEESETGNLRITNFRLIGERRG